MNILIRPTQDITSSCKERQVDIFIRIHGLQEIKSITTKKQTVKNPDFVSEKKAFNKLGLSCAKLSSS